MSEYQTLQSKAADLVAENERLRADNARLKSEVDSLKKLTPDLWNSHREALVACRDALNKVIGVYYGKELESLYDKPIQDALTLANSVLK